jgi:hypothetical protein
MSTDVSEVHAASETLVDIQLRTWQYIPEDSELQTRCHENLKSYLLLAVKKAVQFCPLTFELHVFCIHFAFLPQCMFFVCMLIVTQ